MGIKKFIATEIIKHGLYVVLLVSSIVAWATVFAGIGVLFIRLTGMTGIAAELLLPIGIFVNTVFMSTAAATRVHRLIFGFRRRRHER